MNHPVREASGTRPLTEVACEGLDQGGNLGPPGEHLVVDWGSSGRVHVFCAVLAWARRRFVRFAADERSATMLAMLGECFAELGGTPQVVRADRMGCLKVGFVANRVVPTGDYVRLAMQYRFRLDFCEGADYESKGIVENLVGYAKSDVLCQRPAGSWPTTPAATPTVPRVLRIWQRDGP